MQTELTALHIQDRASADESPSPDTAAEDSSHSHPLPRSTSCRMGQLQNSPGSKRRPGSPPARPMPWLPAADRLYAVTAIQSRMPKAADTRRESTLPGL